MTSVSVLIGKAAVNFNTLKNSELIQLYTDISSDINGNHDAVWNL